jgi:hypothetical protein
LLSLLVAVFLAASGPDALVSVGQVHHPQAVELSGLVASRRYDGVFWTHPDSGNPPLLFAIKADGTVLASYKVDALNLDWEDITTDAEGHLVLCDTGNNTHLVPVRSLIVLDEPDPRKPVTGTLPVLYTIYYRYSHGDVFDAEAVVISLGEALLISKTEAGKPTFVYSIPLREPESHIPPIPKKLGVLPDFSEPATGADLSADGRFLAVCALDVARVYEFSAEHGCRLVREVRYPSRFIEGISWAGNDLFLVEETGRLWAIPARELSLPGRQP